MQVGKARFELATSRSRTVHSNLAELLPEGRHSTGPGGPPGLRHGVVAADATLAPLPISSRLEQRSPSTVWAIRERSDHQTGGRGGIRLPEWYVLV